MVQRDGGVARGNLQGKCMWKAEKGQDPIAPRNPVVPDTPVVISVTEPNSGQQLMMVKPKISQSVL